MALETFMSFLEQALNYPLFSIKQQTVTLTSILMVVLFMGAFLLISKFVVKTLLSRALARTRLDSGLQYTLTRITHYIVMILGAVIAFQLVGIDLSGLIVIFGFLSVGIGFGLQNITSNFISGLILLFERPIKVGDRVVVGETEGDVEEINIRSTTVRTLSNVSIIVPNTEFVSTAVVNWSHGDLKVRINIDVGVSYNSDLDLVLSTMKEVAKQHPKVIDAPAPDVLLMGFGDSSWNMRLRAWIEEPRLHPIVRSDLNCALVRKFRENKIEIPFPQRDLHVRSPLPVPLETTTLPERSAA